MPPRRRRTARPEGQPTREPAHSGGHGTPVDDTTKTASPDDTAEMTSRDDDDAAEMTRRAARRFAEAALRRYQGANGPTDGVLVPPRRVR